MKRIKNLWDKKVNWVGNIRFVCSCGHTNLIPNEYADVVLSCSGNDSIVEYCKKCNKPIYYREIKS